MVKMCKILYILSCFPWRLVKSVKGGIWRLLCFAFALHCFALALLCFAFALQTSRLTRGRKKFWWVDCHNQKLVCLIRPPPGVEKGALFNQLVNRLRRVLGWDLAATPEVHFRFFPPEGKHQSGAHPRSWLAPLVVLICPKGVLRWKKLD